MDARRDLNQLLHFYEAAIERQHTLLEKTKKGKFKSTHLSDAVLTALVKGDLKLLNNRRDEITKQIVDLDKSKKNGTSDSPRSEISDF